jgi:catechol 2,3-dioxygenase-like lactoylglutathione lyase family enzyme
MGAISIRGLDHVVIRAANLDRALGFYRDVLGCAEVRRIDSIGLVQLRCGISMLDLVDVDGPIGKGGGAAAAEGGRNMDHFAVELVGFDEARIRAHLEAHGVEPGEVVERCGAKGNGPSMYIRDPDDNVVELKGYPDSC